MGISEEMYEPPTEVGVAAVPGPVPRIDRAARDRTTVIHAPSTGWLPDWPDTRDFTRDTETVASLLAQSGLGEPNAATLPSTVDLRAWATPIDDQGSARSATAFACASILEYFERRAFGHDVALSRLFIYKIARRRLGWTGDTGISPRSALAAIQALGVPPEDAWPYQLENINEEPDAYCYALAQSTYSSLVYYRLDPWDRAPADVLLTTLRAHLAAGLPFVCGFTLYGSAAQARATGSIPFPASGDRIVGGHAVAAFGYDDTKKLRNDYDRSETTGALLIRNSWGEEWGTKGYGWLPYKYVLSRLAADFWTVGKSYWLESGQFGL